MTELESSDLRKRNWRNQQQPLQGFSAHFSDDAVIGGGSARGSLDRLAGGKLLIFKRVGESSDRDGISMGTRALR